MALGVILTPYGANGPGWYSETGSAYGGRGTYLPQPGPNPLVDYFHNTRGEVGFYYDTQLGAIPTDAELATVYQCYTPVASGWINTKEGYVTPPWRFGWDPAGAYGPPTSLSGLRGEASATDVLAAMNAHNDRMRNLAIISTTAVSISAMFTLWTRWKRLRMDMKRKRK